LDSGGRSYGAVDLLADQDDATGEAFGAQGLGRLRTGRRRAHDHERPLVSHRGSLSMLARPVSQETASPTLAGATPAEPFKTGQANSGVDTGDDTYSKIHSPLPSLRCCSRVGFDE
jgi:hypothetical protein